MNVVDSSGWLEYFADGPNAQFFSSAIEDTAQLLVPTVTLYEVFKRVLPQRGEANALQVTGVMQQGKVVNLDAALALQAAQLSSTLKLPMAHSVMLASARAFDAILWTQDADFKGLPDVRFVETG